MPKNAKIIFYINNLKKGDSDMFFNKKYTIFHLFHSCLPANNTFLI